MEKTAVEWLVEQFKTIVFYSEEAKQNCIEQAKEMQKQQLIEATIYGNTQEFYDGTEMIAEQYYNEKYNK